MGKLPKSTTNQSQMNKDIEKSLVAILGELYPGTQIKVKSLAMRSENLDNPPALDVVLSVALEIVVLPEYEDEIPD